MIWFVIPESLAPTQLSRAKAAYYKSKAQARGGIRGLLATLTSFLSPLKMFVPVTVAMGDNPLKRREDWNLTLLAMANGLVVMLMVGGFFEDAVGGLCMLILSHCRGHTRSNSNMVAICSDVLGWVPLTDLSQLRRRLVGVLRW